MRKSKIIFIVLSLALFCLPALLSLGIRYLPANNQAPLGLTQKLYEDRIVKDKVAVSFDNFTAIGLSFKNPNLANKKEVLLSVATVDGEIVRSAILSGSTVPDGGFVRFSFAPMGDSKGKEYAISLSSPASGEKEALEVYLSLGTKEPAEVAYYKPASRVGLARDIYSNWIARFLQDKPFAVFYLALIALGTFYLAFGKRQTI
jgi:hypothetical protein